MLSDLVIWYLFFGGVGGGACVVFLRSKLPTASPMTVGAYALVVTLCVCGAMAVFHGFDGVDVSDMFCSSIAVVRICGGIIVVVYAGLLLSEVASVLFWMTPFGNADSFPGPSRSNFLSAFPSK